MKIKSTRAPEHQDTSARNSGPGRVCPGLDGGEPTFLGLDSRSSLPAPCPVPPVAVPRPFSPGAVLRGESGFVLIVAMSILLIVTFLGIISITTTSMDVDISRNIRMAGRSFYITDGCISLARTVLEETTDYNAVLAGHGNSGDLLPAQSDWPYPFTSTGEERPGVILYDLGGAPILDYAFSGGTITAYVRNNEDDPSLLWNTDTDTIVVVTCEGKFGISSQSEIVAAVARVILGAEFYGDYPQKNLGPQNLNLVEFEIQF